MWNDEDNNPYGDDFDRRDSFTSSITNSTSPTPHECSCFLKSSNSAPNSLQEPCSKTFPSIHRQMILTPIGTV